jgi:hypothetical protein
MKAVEARQQPSASPVLAGDPGVGLLEEAAQVSLRLHDVTIGVDVSG